MGRTPAIRKRGRTWLSIHHEKHELHEMQTDVCGSRFFVCFVSFVVDRSKFWMSSSKHSSKMETASPAMSDLVYLFVEPPRAAPHSGWCGKLPGNGNPDALSFWFEPLETGIKQ
jgi:hypothetical protein